MAGSSYKSHGIVVRKAKLRESDAIITLVDEAGSRIEAVAHGARKPGSRFSGRLELLSEVDLVCSKGRSLDVITDCRISKGKLRSFSIEQSVAGAPIAELANALAQPELAQDRLFDLLVAFLDALAAAAKGYEPALSAMALLKMCAIGGLRPTFSTCAVCGRRLPVTDEVPFSCLEGGVVCQECQRPADAVVCDGPLIAWCSAMLHARFAELESLGDPRPIASDILLLCKSWIRAHVGCRMRSLDFLMACSLSAPLALR